MLRLFRVDARQVRSVILAGILSIGMCFSGAFANASEVFAVLGDAGRWNSSTRSLRDSMMRSGVFQLVMPGDNLYSGTYEGAWRPWLDEGFQFPVVAIGNHNDGYSKETRFFGVPGETYSYVVPFKARMIVLNSDNKKTVTEQMQFLEDELNNSREPLNFLVYHHPSYTMTKDHSWSERREFQLAIRPLLKKYRAKLTAVILGHDHIATIGHFGDLPYLLSGAGQNMRKAFTRDEIQDGTHVKTDWVVGGFPVWMKLELLSTGAVVQAIRASDDKVLCTVELATGSRAKTQPDCTLNSP